MRPRTILIVGKGGFGREVECYLLALEQHWVVRWVDDNDLTADYTMDTAPFDGPHPTVVAVGNPKSRERLTLEALARGAVLPCFSFDGVLCRSHLTPSSGVILCPRTIVTAGVKVGRGVHVNLNCTIGHDAEIGEFTTISPGVAINGFDRIGRRVFIGAGAVLVPHVTVGHDAVIGAGAVVVHDVPDGATVVGNPARVIKCPTPP